MRVKVVELQGTQGDVACQGYVCSAAQSHGKGIGRPRADTGETGREAVAAEEPLDERIDTSMSMEVHPGTEKEAHRVSVRAGRQAGELTRAELANDTKRGLEIRRTRAGAALAVYAGSAIAWVEANILIIASNLESSVFLGLGGSRRQ